MFAGLTDRDFDAFLPNKWKSNVFNRERLEVKQKLLTLGKDLSPGMIGGDGAPLVLEASVEHPALWNHKQVEAQHLFFSRHETARRELDLIIDRARPMSAMLDDPTPQRNHLHLAATLTHEHVEVSLRLHPDARVDRQNLERKVADLWEREQFLGGVRLLGPGFAVAVTGGARVPAEGFDDAGLRAILADFARPEAPGQIHWLSIGIQLSRGDVLAAGPGLETRMSHALEALLPLYGFIAWSRDNDYVSMREMLKQEKQAKKQKGLAKNDKVKIVRGLFAGRLGTVQEIDARGALRVLLGAVAVKVGADEVEKT